jgi:hypothetical protein
MEDKDGLKAPKSKLNMQAADGRSSRGSHCPVLDNWPSYDGISALSRLATRFCLFAEMSLRRTLDITELVCDPYQCASRFAQFVPSRSTRRSVSVFLCAWRT